jgi:hypothetical protein
MMNLADQSGINHSLPYCFLCIIAMFSANGLEPLPMHVEHQESVEEFPPMDIGK